MPEDEACNVPAWVPLEVRCRECGNQWQDWAPSGVRLGYAVAYLSALRCDVCGAGPDKLVIPTTPGITKN